MFKKGLTTHCLVVPAASSLRSCAQSGAGGEILISSTASVRPIFTLFKKVQARIADVYTVGETGTYAIDEARIPPECLLPNYTNTSREHEGAPVSIVEDRDSAVMTLSIDSTTHLSPTRFV